MRSASLTLALSSLLLASCNDHVFKVVDPTCHAEEVEARELEIGKPVDILIVVDNSGSMCEEQADLQASFLDPNCSFDVNNPPADLINPTPEQVEELSATCGFIQILSLFEATDFRLGVITTDVSPCDNNLGQANSNEPTFLDANCFGRTFPERGRHPQRGCLQPPAFDGGRKFLQIGDEGLDTKFKAILDNMQTWGSGFERGLDATVAFLQRDVGINDDCAGDRDAFIRDDARLAVIYITDEDDCSHGDAFPDENEGLTCEPDGFEPNAVSARECYDQPENLTDPAAYATFLQQFKPNLDDVKVAVIGGAVGAGDNLVAANCVKVDDAPSDQCTETRGNSNRDSLCGENGTQENCCAADGSTRYLQFANLFPADNRFASSICQDFRSTMIDVAQFIGRVEDITLQQPPPNPGEIIVVVTRADGTTSQLDRIDDEVENPATDGGDGFQYDGVRTIKFYGPSAPQPGDDVEVHFAAYPVENPCNEPPE